MFCLHGKPAVQSTTDKGTFWSCGEPSSCQFVCPEGHEGLYGKATEKFLATKQTRPMCCAIGTSEERRYARIKVVRDVTKESFGRPFFMCSKKNGRCNYFAWADEYIIQRPICGHGKPCNLRKVNREGPSQGRRFFCCSEPKEKSCKFFVWYDTVNPRSPQPTRA